MGLVLRVALFIVNHSLRILGAHLRVRSASFRKGVLSLEEFEAVHVRRKPSDLPTPAHTSVTISKLSFSLWALHLRVDNAAAVAQMGGNAANTGVGRIATNQHVGDTEVAPDWIANLVCSLLVQLLYRLAVRCSASSGRLSVRVLYPAVSATTSETTTWPTMTSATATFDGISCHVQRPPSPQPSLSVPHSRSRHEQDDWVVSTDTAAACLCFSGPVDTVEITAKDGTTSSGDLSSLHRMKLSVPSTLVVVSPAPTRQSLRMRTAIESLSFSAAYSSATEVQGYRATFACKAITMQVRDTVLSSVDTCVLAELGSAFTCVVQLPAIAMSYRGKSAARLKDFTLLTWALENQGCFLPPFRLAVSRLTINQLVIGLAACEVSAIVATLAAHGAGSASVSNDRGARDGSLFPLVASALSHAKQRPMSRWRKLSELVNTFEAENSVGSSGFNPAIAFGVVIKQVEVSQLSSRQTGQRLSYQLSAERVEVVLNQADSRVAGTTAVKFAATSVQCTCTLLSSRQPQASVVLTGPAEALTPVQLTLLLTEALRGRSPPLLSVAITVPRVLADLHPAVMQEIHSAQAAGLSASGSSPQAGGAAATLQRPAVHPSYVISTVHLDELELCARLAAAELSNHLLSNRVAVTTAPVSMQLRLAPIVVGPIASGAAGAAQALLLAVGEQLPDAVAKAAGVNALSLYEPVTHSLRKLTGEAPLQGVTQGVSPVQRIRAARMLATPAPPPVTRSTSTQSVHEAPSSAERAPFSFGFGLFRRPPLNIAPAYAALDAQRQ